MKRFITCFEDLDDPRSGNAALHDFHTLLIIALCTVLCGGQGAVDMALFAKAKEPFLREFLDLGNGPPSHDTAPVTKRSGKSCIVVMRYAAQARLRQAVFHWARVAVQNDPKCRSRYDALRARGHSYGRALRGVADRLLGVACVLLQRRAMFDPNHGTPAAP